MRKPSILDALFTAPRQGILATTLMHPERWWYLSDLARHLRLHHATLQRDLARLSMAGVLLSRKDGNRIYYRANPDSPVFPELRGLLAKTAGLADVVGAALAAHASKIVVAFVFGSVAAGTQTSESDVDLMIIGDVGIRDLMSGVSDAEKQLGRPVNPVVYTREEFVNKVAAKNPFLARVLDGPKLHVVGTEAELGRLAQGGTRQGARSGPRRDRRTSPRR